MIDLWRPALTPRQVELLPFVVAGWSNQQIAEQHTLVPRTTLSHVDHILTRLAVPNRTTLALWAIATGTVDMERAVNLMLQRNPHLGARYVDGG